VPVDVPGVAVPVPSPTPWEEDTVRIVPVTGDLPAIVTAPPPPVRTVGGSPPPPATAPVEHLAATDTGAGTAAGDRRPPAPAPKPFFDPPLIAQRAVLGLPTGFLIADLARSQGLPYAAVAAAVDREMPRDTG
jgi:hypothetical protein